MGGGGGKKVLEELFGNAFKAIGGGGEDLRRDSLRGFEGVFRWWGPGGGPQKDLVGCWKTFGARNDRPFLGTITNEKWPHKGHIRPYKKPLRAL